MSVWESETLRWVVFKMAIGGAVERRAVRYSVQFSSRRIKGWVLQSSQRVTRVP